MATDPSIPQDLTPEQQEALSNIGADYRAQLRALKREYAAKLQALGGDIAEQAAAYLDGESAVDAFLQSCALSSQPSVEEAIANRDEYGHSQAQLRGSHVWEYDQERREWFAKYRLDNPHQ